MKTPSPIGITFRSFESNLPWLVKQKRRRQTLWIWWLIYREVSRRGQTHLHDFLSQHEIGVFGRRYQRHLAEMSGLGLLQEHSFKVVLDLGFNRISHSFARSGEPSPGVMKVYTLPGFAAREPNGEQTSAERFTKSRRSNPPLRP